MCNAGLKFEKKRNIKDLSWMYTYGIIEYTYIPERKIQAFGSKSPNIPKDREIYSSLSGNEYALYLYIMSLVPTLITSTALCIIYLALCFVDVS